MRTRARILPVPPLLAHTSTQVYRLSYTNPGILGVAHYRDVRDSRFADAGDIE
jgi:hypothetical protein